MFGFNKFLTSLKEDPKILLDSESEFYLDWAKFFKTAETNIKISHKLVNSTSDELLKKDNQKCNTYLKYYSLYNFKERVKEFKWLL